MENAQLFLWLNTLVLPQWLLMILLPRHKLTQFLVRIPVIPLCLAVIYALLLFQSKPDLQGLNSFEGIKNLFNNEQALLAGWVHYLAFDLLVGCFLLKHSLARQLPAFSRISGLLFTFMLGPFGLLIYYLQFTLFKKQHHDYAFLSETK